MDRNLRSLTDAKCIEVATFAIEDEQSAYNVKIFLPVIGRNIVEYILFGEVGTNYCTASIPITSDLKPEQIEKIKSMVSDSIIFDRKTDKGFRVIDLKLHEIQKLGAIAPICDNCNTPLFMGVYIGVLGNRTYCQTCFDNWHEKAKYYKSDKRYEDSATNKTLRILND